MCKLHLSIWKKDDNLQKVLFSHSWQFEAQSVRLTQFCYLGVYFVAVILAAHFDELAVDALEDVEDISHQCRLANFSCRWMQQHRYMCDMIHSSDVL